MRRRQMTRRHIPWIYEYVCFTGYLFNLSGVVATVVYQAVAGGRVLLPCNVSRTALEDAVTLILWYKEDTKVPIYSLDARKEPIDKARHFPSVAYGTRMYFDVDLSPPSLKIDPVHAEDVGNYKCRVEYRRSRTLSYSLSLNVIVPPREAIIMDENGQKLHDVIGPYDEGSNLSLTCEAEGGVPSPSVTWWRDSVLLDDVFSSTPQGKVRNDLSLPILHRSDLMAGLTCQASNTNLTVPTSSSISIDLNLKPLDVRITSPVRPLSAGKRAQIECESFGSRPRAVMSWWKGEKKLQTGSDVVSDNGNLTLSTLSLVPLPEDNGKKYTCKAENPLLPNSGLQDERIITVHYAPKLRLALGANIQHTAIKEGSDVYFDCNIKANPEVTRMGWIFEGEPVKENKPAGIIVSSQSLVLQHVGKHHRGLYLCVAENSEGEGRSEEVFLDVQYAPVCKHIQGNVYGVARYETINVTCEVEADPADVTFYWSLNNSVENIEIRSFLTEGTMSTATYSPRTMLGYGALMCWARNNIGVQREPCVVRIIPAGPPETVRNCVVTNQTLDSVTVECDLGYDGGLPQHFHLEVYNSVGEFLQDNLTSSDIPVFTIGGLPTGTSFILVLYAANVKGRSNSVALLTNTLHPAERRTASETDAPPVSPILGVLIGIVTALVLIAIIIVIVMRLQGRVPQEKHKGPIIQEEIKKSDITLKHYKEDPLDATVESPDIIPAKNEAQVFTTGEKSGYIDSRTGEIMYDPIKQKGIVSIENIVALPLKKFPKDHLYSDCITETTLL